MTMPAVISSNEFRVDQRYKGATISAEKAAGTVPSPRLSTLPSQASLQSVLKKVDQLKKCADDYETRLTCRSHHLFSSH